MLKDPQPGSLDFELLVLCVYDERTMVDVQDGKRPPPENLVAKALKKARERFDIAVRSQIFEEIIKNMAECRELLHTLRATFKDIGVERCDIKAIEKKLKHVKTRNSSAPILTGRSPDDHISLCLEGNQRLLDN